VGGARRDAIAAAGARAAGDAPSEPVDQQVGGFACGDRVGVDVHGDAGELH
jgi:hypothetical protein